MQRQQLNNVIDRRCEFEIDFKFYSIKLQNAAEGETNLED